MPDAYHGGFLAAALSGFIASAAFVMSYDQPLRSTFILALLPIGQFASFLVFWK